MIPAPDDDITTICVPVKVVKEISKYFHVLVKESRE